MLTADDLHLFNEGTHARLYERLGAQVLPSGTAFAVWAPDAEAVTVIGDFNGWDDARDPLVPVASSGIWEGFVAGASGVSAYKYHLRTPSGDVLDKADPFAFCAEDAAAHGLDRLGPRLRLGRRDWMHARAARHAR